MSGKQTGDRGSNSPESSADNDNLCGINTGLCRINRREWLQDGTLGRTFNFVSSGLVIFSCGMAGYSFYPSSFKEVEDRAGEGAASFAHRHSRYFPTIEVTEDTPLI